MVRSLQFRSLQSGVPGPFPGNFTSCRSALVGVAEPGAATQRVLGRVAPPVAGPGAERLGGAAVRVHEPELLVLVRCSQVYKMVPQPVDPAVGEDMDPSCAYLEVVGALE